MASYSGTQLRDIKTELTTDPQSIGYEGTGADPSGDAALLNTANRTINVPSFTSDEILQYVDNTEFQALTADEQRVFWGMLGMGSMDPWGRAADVFVYLFGGGSSTITALNAARTQTVSRLTELGLPTGIDAQQVTDAYNKQ